ncbi:MAG: hypothetical protein GY768_17025 [Planctomycetaceae bacterium]|nr:hypothetical protein [Planctomycetaceae bacterium]
MARIDGVQDSAEAHIDRVFAHQVKQYGQRLKPYELFARCPSIFRSVVGMWGGLDSSGLVDHALVALVNRRVAELNGCVF